jgi:hypothetical protein
MNGKTLGLVVVLLMSLACGLLTPGTPAQPGVETIVAATFQALTAVAPPTQPPVNGTLVSVNNISFIIPPKIGSGAQVETIEAVPPSDDMPWWDVAPTYHEYKIQGYPLFGTFHTPTIYVYPVNEYLQMDADIAKLFDSLKAILNSPGEPLPEICPSCPPSTQRRCSTPPNRS